MSTVLTIPADLVQLDDIIIGDNSPHDDAKVITIWPPGQFGNPNLTLTLVVTFGLQSITNPKLGNWILTYPVAQDVTVSRG